MQLSFRTKLFFAGILVFVAGISIGIIVGKKNSNSVALKNIREESANYKYINPLLFVKVLEDQTFSEYSDLKKDISSYIERSVAQDKASDISVFFRNLDGSQWLSINADEIFSPASMFKVITLISVLRVSESNPALLSKVVTLEGEDENLVDAQERYPTKNPVRSGKTYTVKSLLEHLIIESDNVANVALISLIGEDKIIKTYQDLQLPSPATIQNGGYTTEQYSYLFRSLYNGTYLSRSSSEFTLDLLGKTNFTQGIVAGVAASTTVSHKFGVRTVLSDRSTKDSHILSYRELHDCGIVYYPQNPYFICIMTRGTDFPMLEALIKDISKISWDYTENLHSKQ